MDTDHKKDFPLWDFSDHRIQSLVMKVTEACNLGCTYCYRKGMVRSSEQMSLLTVSRAIESYARWIDRSGDHTRPIALIWHGGEPLLCGTEYYEAIFEIEAEFKARGYRFINAFQTNGTLIDDAWAEFFLKHDVLVGISLDGPRRVHDIHRKYPTGASSFERTLRAARCLAGHGLPCSAISVITNETSPHLCESLDFFVDEGFKTVDFIPCFFQGDASSLDSDNYLRAMIELYDHWKSRHHDAICVRFLDDVEQKIMRKEAATGCELAGCCGENLSINMHGDVYPCEYTSVFLKWKLGNVREKDLADMSRCGMALGCDPYCEARLNLIQHIRTCLSEPSEQVA